MIDEKPRAAGDDLAAVQRWPQALEELHARIAHHFRRPEVRERARCYLAGLLGRAEGKSTSDKWPNRGARRAHVMQQRLLNAAYWDAHASCGALR